MHFDQNICYFFRIHRIRKTEESLQHISSDGNLEKLTMCADGCGGSLYDWMSLDCTLDIKAIEINVSDDSLSRHRHLFVAVAVTVNVSDSPSRPFSLDFKFYSRRCGWCSSKFKCGGVGTFFSVVKVVISYNFRVIDNVEHFVCQ